MIFLKISFSFVSDEIHCFLFFMNRIKISDHGSISVKARGISIGLTLQLGRYTYLSKTKQQRNKQHLCARIFTSPKKSFAMKRALLIVSLQEYEWFFRPGLICTYLSLHQIFYAIHQYSDIVAVRCQIVPRLIVLFRIHLKVVKFFILHLVFFYFDIISAL